MATDAELAAQADAHFRKTTITYPAWQKKVKDGAYNPPDGSGTEWGKGFGALAQIGKAPVPPDPPPTTTPPVVTNLRITAKTDTTATAAWTAAAGAAKYKLALVVGGNTTYSDTSALSKSFTGLAPGTQHEVDVQTVMPDGKTSAWAGRVKFTTDPGTTPPPDPPPTSGKFRFALGSSGDQQKSATIAQQLGVHLSRTYDKTPGAAVSSIQDTCGIYQSRGVTPYILCNWGNSDDIEGLTPGNIPEWAKAVGPGGSWYQAHPEWSSRAVTHFEMGNEWFYNYRGGINQNKCMAYARAFRDTAVAVKAANPKVGLLFMTDIDNQGTDPYNRMVDWFYAAVPNLHEYIAGYTFHTYGPSSSSNVFSKMTTILARMESHGAPKTIPIWITEDGVASDNGRNLTDNYGWPTNQTYAQAGAALRDKLRALLAHAVVGPRLAVWTNYQAHDQQASGATNEREHYFGVVQSNLALKGDISQSAKDHATAYPA